MKYKLEILFFLCDDLSVMTSEITPFVVSIHENVTINLDRWC